MLLAHIEVCLQGSVLAFEDIPSFATWVHSVEGSSKVIGIRVIGAQHGHGNPLLSHFVTLELHLQGCWKRRRIGYLQKRCGHRLIGREAGKRTRGEASETGELSRLVEGVRCVTPGSSDVSLQEAPPTTVTSEAEGYISGPQGQRERLCPPQQSSPVLPLLPIQHQPPPPALSPSDGSATSLSSLEREAIRTRGRPWRSRWADKRDLKQYYPVWITLAADDKGEKGPCHAEIGILRGSCQSFCLPSCCCIRRAVCRS